MKITIRAAGLIRSGPERAMVDSYLKRAKALARPLGITDVVENAVDMRRAKNRKDETEFIFNPLDPTDVVIVLDERGKDLTSRQLAAQIGNWRDDGRKNVIFTIGYADGFDPDALPSKAVKWRLGGQTWPHKLVRVMISEQIYRALSILAGTPYHRD
jgi:23S rRNA (pseudouridine1915-N3)-methyltransferase